jgi:hypothetical protein
MGVQCTGMVVLYDNCSYKVLFYSEYGMFNTDGILLDCRRTNHDDR